MSFDALERECNTKLTVQTNFTTTIRSTTPSNHRTNLSKFFCVKHKSALCIILKSLNDILSKENANDFVSPS